ncbi:MAG: hypothetical protein ACO307_11325, partial [Ilumatobacteraceae bacterium]
MSASASSTVSTPSVVATTSSASANASYMVTGSLTRFTTTSAGRAPSPNDRAALAMATTASNRRWASVR